VIAEVEINFPEKGTTAIETNAYLRNGWSASQLVAVDNLVGAAELYHKNLELSEKEEPRNQMEIAEAASELGHIYLRLSKSQEAEEMLKKGVTAYTAEGVNDTPQVARAEEELAGIYLEQKRFSEAETWFSRALPILMNAKVSAVAPEVQKTIATSIARALFGLASANFQAGDLNQANFFCERTIAATKDSGVSASDQKNIYLSCAGASRALGRIGEAEARQSHADQSALASNRH